MFGLIRIVMGGFLYIGVRGIIRKTSFPVTRMSQCILILLMIVIVSVSAFFPIENFFVTFSSPDAAYKYYSGRNDTVELVVEGKNCDLIVVGKNEARTHLILPRTANGWKIGIGSDTRRIVQKFSDSYTIYTYQYRNTDEYFIVITSINGEPLEIADSYNSVFCTLTETGNLQNTPVTAYFANISKFNQNYRLIINNMSVTLN